MTEDPTAHGTHRLQDNNPTPPHSSLTPLARVFIAAGCRTQIELAGILGIRQSSISDAKKRQAIPAEWLIKLLRLKGISPEWILTGRGPQRLSPPRDDEPARIICHTEIRPPMECSAQELVNELVRRALTAL